MSPSADPVAKYSSWGSMAIHFTWLSCAENLWRMVLERTSMRQTSPFFPAEMSTWCCGAKTKLVAPWSWHVNATTNALPWGKIESQMHTFLLSELCPAEEKFYLVFFIFLNKYGNIPVASKLQEPKKTKSLMPLLWHWCICLQSQSWKKIEIILFSIWKVYCWFLKKKKS